MTQTLPPTLPPPAPVLQHSPDLTGRIPAHLAPPMVMPRPPQDPPEPSETARRRVATAGGLDLLR